jgi:hypothetical protein
MSCVYITIARLSDWFRTSLRREVLTVAGSSPTHSNHFIFPQQYFDCYAGRKFKTHFLSESSRRGVVGSSPTPGNHFGFYKVNKDPTFASQYSGVLRLVTPPVGNCSEITF